MKILVTGGAGYIGSHTCKLLALQGHEVIVYDNLITGHREFVKWGPLIYGDINDTQRLRHTLKFHQPDAIIHFAAHAYVGESVHNPGKYFRNNVTGTLSILEAMRDEGIKNIVVSSTCAVYGQPEISPISEDIKANPINPYGASKLFMERMLEDFSIAHGIKYIGLRYFNAAGCDPDGEIGEIHYPETHLIPKIIYTALGIVNNFEIYGNDYKTMDGTCIRDYVHVNDLARAHILAAQYLLDGGDSILLNLGMGKGYSVLEIISRLENIASVAIPTRYTMRRAGDPPLLIADPAHAFNVLGWQADKDITSILVDSFEYIRKNILKINLYQDNNL